MRIKKLEIFGFKSFKDRTVIQFDQGITGIVGPNGCGKSNIVDALVWVMGEMSAKHLRGSSMEDVIFAGAEGYAPMGLAEVSLTLENDGGPFPAQYARFSEVMVTRRLNRSGESEYFVNKEPARLRDIQEIFMDTGAGSKGFSIIEQGAIGKIITSKPEDRRMLIEEAAGITKFKIRKRESQRKIESTDQNLVRLQDIIGEQKRQIDSLERQAQRAERYRKIKVELQEKDMWLSAHSYLKAHDELQVAENAFAAARDMDVGGESQVASLESRIATLRLELANKEVMVQEKQSEHRSLLTQVQETEFRIRELNLTIAQAQRSNDMTGSMLAQYKLRRENLVAERERLESSIQALREEVILLEGDFEKQNADFLAIQERISSADAELTEKRREMLTVSTGVSHLESREAVARARYEEETKKTQQAEVLRAELNEKKIEFTERRRRIFNSLEVERQMHLDLTKDVDLLEQNLSGVRTSLLNRRQECDALKDEFNLVTSRLYGLEDLQANFEGFEEGVKNILMWQRADAEGASSSAQKFKPLSEVVEVPERYEIAMEASLGTRLQLLLSESSDHAVGAVDYLKAQKGGRSSFLSGDGGSSVEVTSEVSSGMTIWQDEAELRQMPGFDSFLKDVVSLPDSIKSVIKPNVTRLFADIVVVDSVRSALNMRSRYPGRTFVTRDGDVLSHDGVITGGAVESADSGVLKRRREIKLLSLQREEVSGKLQLAQLVVKKITEQEAGLVEQVEAAKKSAVEREITIAGLRKDLERAEMELSQVESAFVRETKQYEYFTNEVQKLKESLQDIEQQLTEFKLSKVALESRVEALTKELESSRIGVDEKGRVVTDLKIRLGSKKQEVEGLERQVLLVQTTLGDVVTQLEQMSEESQRNSDTLSTSQIAVENSQTELQRAIHQAQEAERSMAGARDQFETIQAVLRTAEAELSKTNHDLNQMRAQLSEAQIRVEQLKMREIYLVDQIRDRYMVNLCEVAHQYRDIVADEIQYAKDVEDLRDKLKRIGEVNLSAIQEYEDVIKRYEFLSQQHTDLLEAKDHLRRVVDRINRICSRRFKETFDQVNERFQKVFPVLFGGGEAMLVIVDEQDGDDPGIEIVARPPGKKLQSITLLSGGEKALTAVSLIFSIFLVRPSPFCLLDEVDAPLDDANVIRFNDLVKEMARRSQIIIVTHNKHTMKVNDKLYGVTMQEKGVSKMVSVSLADAEKMVV